MVWQKEPLSHEELTRYHLHASDALNDDSSEHVAAIRAVPSQKQGTEGGGTPALLNQPLSPGYQKRNQEEPVETVMMGRELGLGPGKARQIGPVSRGERV